MRKTRRLVLSLERLRILVPDQLGRVKGGEPNASLNSLCYSVNIECGTLTTEPLTNTQTNTLNTLNTVNTLTFLE